jgi:hypothetical protein
MRKILFTLIVLGIFNPECFAQLKVLQSGNVQMGGSPVSSTAKLNLFMNDGSTIYSKTEHSYGWGDAIKSQVNRNDAIAFSGWNNQGRTFAVFGNGDVFSQTNYYSSDLILKEDVRGIQQARQQLFKLQGVSYLMKSDQNTETRRRHSGLIAQEVEKVFPDMVFETDQGVKAIAYIELIPYLIEALKEQQNTIDNLQAEIDNIINDCCSSAGQQKNATIPGNYGETGTINAVLYQNTPNPFSNETVIRYEIPENVGKCQLHILNMNGSLLKTISINAPGIGSTVIHGRELKPGMYLYSLVIDGQIIDTKQMLLTK